MRRAACLLVLLLVLPLGGAEIRGDRSYQPHQKIILSADVPKGAQTLWDVTPECDVEEVEGKLFVWAKPGRYAVTLTAIDFDTKKVTRARFSFVVQGEEPPPPKPDPTPPPKPQPDDALAKALKAAYAQETAADRAKHLASFAALYRQAATMDLSGCKTVANLYSKLIEASRQLLPAEALPVVRKVVGAEVSAVLGSVDGDLAAEKLKAAQALFGRLGAALEAAGK